MYLKSKVQFVNSTLDEIPCVWNNKRCFPTKYQNVSICSEAMHYVKCVVNDKGCHFQFFTFSEPRH